MVDAVPRHFVWFCVIDPVVKTFLVMVSVGCLGALRTMPLGAMRGVRHGNGHKSPRRRKRDHGTSQKHDKDSSGPTHNAVNYVTQHLEVK